MLVLDAWNFSPFPQLSTFLLMCGIAGIIHSETPPAPFSECLAAMRKALGHRGPDDGGLFFSANGQVGFAHTRLAILDLSPAGHQPMKSADGRLVITFNGEIYNFRELRA